MPVWGQLQAKHKKDMNQNMQVILPYKERPAGATGYTVVSVSKSHPASPAVLPMWANTKAPFTMLPKVFGTMFHGNFKLNNVGSCSKHK